MHPDNREALERRVVQAAEVALADHQYVSAVDVLIGMGLLAPAHFADWRKGHVDFLERVIQGHLSKITVSMAAFRRWAREKGLRPSETRYTRGTRGGTVDLRFSKSGDPNIEQTYRTHYISPVLSERKKAALVEKLNQTEKPVVFQNLRESQCSECGVEIESNSFLFMEAGQPLCLPCARLDNLEYLPSGDAALTRRATKYSAKTAVVVRFSRSRGHYERQGILVETAAVEKAEQECASDADARSRQRARGAVARAEEDRKLVARMTEEMLILFPSCPPEEVAAIAAHTAVRNSGRVGRTAAGRKLDEQALGAAVAAAIRHRHTNYDSLLASGLERGQARESVSDHVQALLQAWGKQNCGRSAHALWPNQSAG